MPILLLLLIIEFLPVALFFLDVHFIREWYFFKDTYRDEYARNCLYWAIGITAYSVLGKFVVSTLVSKTRSHEEEPQHEHSKYNEKLRRPDGSEIHIEIFGDNQAQPILFIHGWNANSSEWYYERKYFSKDYKVVLMDLPGLGKSKRPKNKDYSLQKMASDVEAVIEHLKLKKVILWGHSIGGMIILTYCTQIATNLEQKVKGIILHHTTFTNPLLTSILSGLLRKIQKPVLYPICYLMIALSPIFWLTKWMNYLNGALLLSTRFLMFTGTQTPAQLDFISQLSAMAPPSVFARGMLGMMKTYDVTVNLKDINVPALIFAGNYDRLTKPIASEYMKRHILNSQLATLKPAGHQGLVERHKEANEVAQKFIQEL
jgi:pimeloyl-ACP methyl ester carboxylesterase